MRDKMPRLLVVLNVVSLLLLVAGSLMVFLYAPMERVMGPVQKVFYFHVACAWVGMLSFIAAAGSGIGYLASKKMIWDIVSLSAVEIGMVFMFVAIVSGSIWAHPIWNTWWTWDPRLTTVTIMELIYAAYLMLRKGIDESERRARFGAVYSIVAALTVPLTFFSIRYFRTIHPVVIGSGGSDGAGAFDMTTPMLQTFIFGLITFSVLFGTLLWNRVRLGSLKAEVEELKIISMDEGFDNGLMK